MRDTFDDTEDEGLGVGIGEKAVEMEVKSPAVGVTVGPEGRLLGTW